jgi:hypothetical protein
MLSLQIDEALSNDVFCRKLYTGVYAADTIPRTLKFPAIFVVNTDAKHLPGTHWIAIHIDHQGYGEYFDSFGRNALVPEHRRFLDQNCKSWTFNDRSLQGMTSAVCGHYSIMFLSYRARGLSMKTFLSLFENTTTNFNDKLVKKMYDNHYRKTCIKSSNNSRIINQCCCARYNV